MKTISHYPNFLRGRHLFVAGLFFVGLMACLAIGVSTAQAQNYYVKDLGMLSGAKACEPAALNNQGHVVGTATAGEFGYAFRYYYSGKEDEMERVGELGSRAFGISPGGIVVGDAFVPKMGAFNHAAFFKGGRAVDLGVLKGDLYSRANAMNGLGYIVGFSGPKRDAPESHAFIWTANTGMLDIGTLGGDFAQAYAVNDAGWITGTAQLRPVGPVQQQTHAFIYQPISPFETYTEPMRDIGTLGGFFSYGMSINSMKHVAGYSTINQADDRTHAFFYNGKSMIDLGLLPEAAVMDSSFALSVNNSDEVVGYNHVRTGDNDQLNRVAFLWNGDKMVNLNHLIGGWSDHYLLLAAVAINDNGQITATAYDYQDGTFKAVLLTPTK